VENYFYKLFSVEIVKDKIIETSLQQFLRHGIRKMTVQKLIDPMGISTKTVYKYFSDKEDLLKHCLLRHYSALAKEFDQVKNESKNPVATLFEIWHKAIELDFGVNHIFYHDLNYYYPQLQDEVLHKIFRKNIFSVEMLIEAGIKQGYFRDDIIPKIIPEVISILYSSITRTPQFKKYKLTTKSLMQSIIDPYLRGICTDKGLKQLKSN
jgi:AcrR family transcriptional regulator